MLAARPDWEVCGEAVDGREAIEKTKLLRPDILLLDITYVSKSEAGRQLLIAIDALVARKSHASQSR